MALQLLPQPTLAWGQQTSLSQSLGLGLPLSLFWHWHQETPVEQCPPPRPLTPPISKYQMYTVCLEGAGVRPPLEEPSPTGGSLTMGLPRGGKS